MTQATFEKGARLERWEKNAADPRGPLKVIGAMIAAESQGAFRDQKHGRDKWEPRAPVNVFGILADLHEGGQPKARRFERRPALRDTGRLERSIAFALVGATAVEVGSNLDYAAVHHYGGTTESKPITPGVRRALWRWLKPKDRSLKARLGWLLNKKFKGETLTQEVPARPFVGLTEQLRRDVREELGLRIFEVGR
jgi:phage gpG-like protein